MRNAVTMGFVVDHSSDRSKYEQAGKPANRPNLGHSEHP